MDDLEIRFTYHAQRYERIRELAKTFAQLINQHCPDSREKSLAITHVEEAVMWANASIARRE